MCALFLQLFNLFDFFFTSFILQSKIKTPVFILAVCSYVLPQLNNIRRGDSMPSERCTLRRSGGAMGGFGEAGWMGNAEMCWDSSTTPMWVIGHTVNSHPASHTDSLCWGRGDDNRSHNQGKWKGMLVTEGKKERNNAASSYCSGTLKSYRDDESKIFKSWGEH